MALVQCPECGHRGLSDHAAACPKCGRTFKRDRRVLYLALASLAISVASATIAWRTFHVVQRPYLGIVEFAHSFEGTPPSKMTYSFYVGNVGSRPGWFVLTKSQHRVVKEGHVYTTPGGCTSQVNVVVMPGQKVKLGGWVTSTEKFTLAEIQDGTAELFVDLDFTYSAEGLLGRREFFYRTNRPFRSR